MKRLAAMAACLGLYPASAWAQELPPPPLPSIPVPEAAPAHTPEPPRAATTVQLAPATPPAPPAAQTLPGTVVPAKPFPTEHYPELTPWPPATQTACPTWQCAPAGCPTGHRLGIAAAINPLNRLRPAGGCESGGVLHNLVHGSDNHPCWDRFWDWFTYHPDYRVKYMPCFIHRPTPYHAPLISFFSYQCREPNQPAVAPPCGVKGCGAKGCAANGCATGQCAQAATGGTRIGAMMSSLLPTREKIVYVQVADAPSLPPGLKYANPAMNPAPTPTTAGQPVTPVSYTGPRPWPTGTPPKSPPPPPVTRPFTNP